MCNGVADCEHGLVCFWLGGWCLDFALTGFVCMLLEVFDCGCSLVGYFVIRVGLD